MYFMQNKFDIGCDDDDDDDEANSKEHVYTSCS